MTCRSSRGPRRHLPDQVGDVGVVGALLPGHVQRGTCGHVGDACRTASIEPVNEGDRAGARGQFEARLGYPESAASRELEGHDLGALHRTAIVRRSGLRHPQVTIALDARLRPCATERAGHAGQVMDLALIAIRVPFEPVGQASQPLELHEAWHRWR